MNILVKKDNQTFGPHSRDEIFEFIESGELTEDDLASLDGEENWDTLRKLLSIDHTEKDPSIFDQFEDDEVDYEKLKEWEDVFVDEEVEETKETESKLEDSSITSHIQPPPVTAASPPPFESSQIADPMPPPLEQESINEHEHTSSFSNESEIQQGSDTPPPSLPLPPPPSASSIEKIKKENTTKRSVKDRISSSHKIKGLNNKQTVIVVKGEGILSKLYTTSLLFIILFIVVCILGLVGLIFAPERIIPILNNIGVPAELIQSIISPKEIPN